MNQQQSSNRPTGWWSQLIRALPYIVIALLTLLVFGQARNHEFLLWDDYSVLAENESLNPIDWTGFVFIWKNAWKEFDAPLVPNLWGLITYFAADGSDPGMASEVSPEVFHLFQLTIHLATSFLVFAILYHLLCHRIAALLGGLLFAIHPVQTETAVWITQTSFTAAGLFCMGAILCYFQAVDATSVVDGIPHDVLRSSTKARVLYTLATALYIVAILCNWVAIALPFGLATLVIGFKQRPWLVVARELSPWFIVSGVVIVVAHTVAGEPAYPTAPFWIRPGIVLDVFAFRVFHLLLPSSCCPDYGHSFENILRNGNLYWSWFFAAVALVFASTTNHRRVWLTLLVAMVLSIVPRIVLLPSDPAHSSLMADHYAYLWMLFPSIGLAFWVAAHPHSFNKLVVIIALSGMAVISYDKTSEFRDNHSIAIYVLENSSKSSIGYRVAGKILAQDQQFDTAIRHLRWALNLEPWNAQVHHDMATVFLAKGEIQRSLTHFERALELEPQRAEYANALAWCLATNPESRFRDGPRAIELALDACDQLECQSPVYLDTLAAAYAEAGEFESAVRTAHLAIDGARTKDQTLVYTQRLKLYQNKKPYHIGFREKQAEDRKPSSALERVD